MSSDGLPKCWPSGVAYLKAPKYSGSLTQEQLSELRKRPHGDGTVTCLKRPKSPCPLVYISKITDLNHPAHGQHGLFAARHLPPDSFIICYLGLVHGAKDTDESSDYDISLDREAELSIDAAAAGNEARFINDYRGISQRGPNAEFRDCYIEHDNHLEKSLGIFVLSAGKSGKRASGIQKGEEVLVSYGKGFWNERRQAADSPTEKGPQT